MCVCVCTQLSLSPPCFTFSPSPPHLQVPGVHDPLDPEYSILKQRLARRARYEKTDVSKLDLVSITKLAERTISNDLEFLVEKAVDTKRVRERELV